MKIAGAKNVGAWHRANKELQKMNGAERVDLAAKVLDSEYGDLAFNDLQSLMNEVGLADMIGSPTTLEQWVTSLLGEGIPLQVWMGKLTFTTYTRSGTAGNYEYAANYTYNIHRFAIHLRKAVRKFIFAKRQVQDMFNIEGLGEGNPGGLPDADPET